MTQVVQQSFTLELIRDTSTEPYVVHAAKKVLDKIPEGPIAIIVVEPDRDRASVRASTYFAFTDDYPPKRILAGLISKVGKLMMGVSE